MNTSFEFVLIFGFLCVVIGIFMIYRYRYEKGRQEHEQKMKELEMRFAQTRPVVRQYNEDVQQSERILERRLREHQQSRTANEYGNPRASSFSSSSPTPPAPSPYTHTYSPSTSSSSTARSSVLSTGASMAVGAAAGAAAMLAAEALKDRWDSHDHGNIGQKEAESFSHRDISKEKPSEVAELERIVAEEATYQTAQREEAWSPSSSYVASESNAPENTCRRDDYSPLYETSSGGGESYSGSSGDE